jgi:hypothetical protein
MFKQVDYAADENKGRFYLSNSTCSLPACCVKIPSLISYFILEKKSELFKKKKEEE